MNAAKQHYDKHAMQSQAPRADIYNCTKQYNTHTHTHTCLTTLFPGLPGWDGTNNNNNNNRLMAFDPGQPG